MEDVQEVARDHFAVLGRPVLVHAPLQRRDQLVAVLLDDKADQLLAHRAEGVDAAMSA